MEPIKCQLCGASAHSIELHLRKEHPDVSLEQYRERYPDAPLLSDEAKRRLEEHAKALAEKQPKVEPVASNVITMQHAALAHVTPIAATPQTIMRKRAFHEIFGLPEDTPGVKNLRGENVMITTIEVAEEFRPFVPEIDEGHVWDVEDLKNMAMAVELNMPLYVWGHKGTGKTTDIEQFAARTGRPLMRTQHTLNTEEAHIVGQWLMKNGQTVFEFGPLAIAMRHGFMYLADEYDFALASVLSVYQPVLEGKALFVKEADGPNRIVKPHTLFRFVATGNTNGSGDETGLYQGTSVQNAANYDRFGMVIQKKYMPTDEEVKIVINRSGIAQKEAKKLVELAGEIRKSFDGGKLSDTISTRSLINIANIGMRRGSMALGVSLCFANKLSRVDRAVVEGVAQRFFGK